MSEKSKDELAVDDMYFKVEWLSVIAGRLVEFYERDGNEGGIVDVIMWNLESEIGLRPSEVYDRVVVALNDLETVAKLIEKRYWPFEEGEDR